MIWPEGIKYRPIQAWPGAQTGRRKTSPFSAPMRRTVEQLRVELREIGAGASAVLQIALEEHQFRNDGAPRSNVTPAHPGVILSIETPDGPLSFPCDTFSRWEDNLRAIVLTMERLRSAGRYGVTKHGEQYRGWRAIESGIPVGPAPFTTAEQALAFLRECIPASLIPDNSRPGNLVRTALRYTHPDMDGGDAADFQRAKDAESFLRSVAML